MTKKKSKSAKASDPIASDQTLPLQTEQRSNADSADRPAATEVAPTKSKERAHFVPAHLSISRNKHWRYISSYHGPWLQLPPEVLDSLACNNFHSPRPQPIDPAVFFDLVKIRRLVEEATDLAVRAANGTASSYSNNAGNGLLGIQSAASLGLGWGSGNQAKLSKERRHRMREHATQKLSHAYHLDEIAASVATMQSASALEDVAKHVLQRNENDPDANYVHFFHEKIPARAVAAATSLKPLDEIINQRHTEGAPYRTRAVMKIFQCDLQGAVKDLTEGLGLCRMYNAQHLEKSSQGELVTARDAAKLSCEYRADAKVDEKDQPSSLECQLLFHRACTHLALACDKIGLALKKSTVRNGAPEGVEGQRDSSPSNIAEYSESRHAIYEARKLVRTYAKRALRDYTNFLSHFDYTPGLPPDLSDSSPQQQNEDAASGDNRRPRGDKLLDMSDAPNKRVSSTLVQRNGFQWGDRNGPTPDLPPIKVHPLNVLFAARPPSDLPPYPSDSAVVVTRNVMRDEAIRAHPDFAESITYHPLLIDALHSLLLCHCLIQTSSKEQLRHAYMVARLARVCDGYPVFLAARSPARGDWTEILRRSNNWIELSASWESLCALTPLPNQKAKEAETAAERRERIKREAIDEALADDRVHDEESFRANVRAREARAAREGEEYQRKEYNRTNLPPAEGGDTTAQGQQYRAEEDVKEYQVSTERAEAIVRWIHEAPPPSASGESPALKPKRKGRLRKIASDLSGMNRLETSVESLRLEDTPP